MRKCCVALLFFGICVVSRASSPAEDKKEKPPEDPRHEELREMRRGLEEALLKNDQDKVLSYLTDDVTITFMDTQVADSPSDVKAYFDKMLKGDKAIVKKYTPKMEADLLTRFHGDTGVVRGHSNDTYDLTDGRNFTIFMRWTATVVKKDGKWKIASLHTSANPFDNPVKDIAVKQTSYWVGGIVGGVGLLLGILLTLLFRRRPA